MNVVSEVKEYIEKGEASKSKPNEMPEDEISFLKAD